MTELKPCPFCGNSKTVYCENDESGFVIEVVCAMCGARGPQFNRRGGAIEAWNKRSCVCIGLQGKEKN